MSFILTLATAAWVIALPPVSNPPSSPQQDLAPVTPTGSAAPVLPAGTEAPAIPSVTVESALPATPQAPLAPIAPGTPPPSSGSEEPAPTATANGFALIVTHNRSFELARADLHFADDDGVKYAQLFAELYGRERVWLLTEMDFESQRLHATWYARARPPTREELSRAIDELNAQITTTGGGPADVHLVFVGQGDIDRGMGFIELADGRLTARQLDEEVIARLQGDRVHLVLDSCNSYFMLNPRSPEIQRWEVESGDTVGLLEKHPHVGVFISTSAEAATFEWNELQSGIFSHELRSGLRGAADLDLDGQITYEELEAFVLVANQALVNDLYRPKLFVRAPFALADTPVVARATGRDLQVTAPRDGRRLVLRDSHGSRIVDMHVASGVTVRVALPREPIVITEEVPGDERPTIIERIFDGLGSTSLDALPAQSPAVTAPSTAPVIADLFRTPFGPVSAHKALAAARLGPPAGFGITRRDEERFRYHLSALAGMELNERRFTGVMVGAFGLTMAAAGFALTDVLGLFGASNEDSSLIPVALGLATFGVGLVVWGIVTYLFDPAEIEILKEYQNRQPTGERERADHVLTFERRVATLVAERRFRRRVVGIIVAGVGIAVSALATTLALIPKRNLVADASLYGAVDATAWLAGYVGFALSMGGAYLAFGHSTPAERVWQLYLQQPTVFGTSTPPVRSASTAGQVRLGLAPVPEIDAGGGGGLSFVVGGQF